MADFVKLVEAARQAYEAGAPDLAAMFLHRALGEVGAGAEILQELPWSSDPRDTQRHGEWELRALRFMSRFLHAPRGDLTDAEAREWSREVFPEQPRAVGPAFYRPGFLETIVGQAGTHVRLTERGKAFVSGLERRRVREEPPEA